MNTQNKGTAAYATPVIKVIEMYTEAAFCTQSEVKVNQLPTIQKGGSIWGPSNSTM